MEKPWINIGKPLLKRFFEVPYFILIFTHMGMFVPCLLKGDRCRLCRLAQDPDSSGLKGTANLGILLWNLGQIIGRKKKGHQPTDLINYLILGDHFPKNDEK